MLSLEELEELAESLKVLTHPVRIRILRELKKGDVCVTELSEKIGASQPNISQHLTLLRARGWIKKRKKALFSYYYLSDKRISIALETISEVVAQFE